MDDRNDMTLGPGVGIIPPHLRNRGYEKLGIKPGEGGIRLDGNGGPKHCGAAELGDVLAAAIDAGADPKQLAENLRGGEAA